MSEFFECYFLWVLLGLFLGFLLFWLIDRFFNRDGSDNDNAKDREIAKLKQELNDCRTSQTKPAAETSPLLKTMDSPITATKIDAAKEFRYRPVKAGRDNLTVVEGIGPKIASLMYGDGVPTFAKLSTMSEEALQRILDNAGPSFRLAKPKTWPKQASMCANGEWAALKAYQDRLKGGVDTDEQ